MEKNYQDSAAQQEMYAAEMRRQQQIVQQQQYQMYRQNSITQIANALTQIDPGEIIKNIGRYGISTLPLDQQEKTFLNNLLCQQFIGDDSDFTSDNWANVVKILTLAISSTYNLQLLQMRQQGQIYGNTPFMQGGGFNYYNPGQQNPFMGGINPAMGMGMPGMPPGGMGMPGMMGGMNPGYPPGYTPRPEPNNEQSEEEKEKMLINQYKQIFSTRIHQVDPIIFINLLLQDNYEIGNNEYFKQTLRMLVANSLWRLPDNALQIVYYIISAIFNSEYQKRAGNDNPKQGGYTPQMPGMMGGMNPAMGMGMPGMPPGGMGMPGMMGGMNPSYNSAMGMGMPGMMGGFDSNYGNPMGGGMMGGYPGFMPPPINGMGYSPNPSYMGNGIGNNSQAAASTAW
jgi:hypothetical protein